MFRLRYKTLICFAILAGLVFSKLIKFFLSISKTLAAATFAENHSWPFFDIQNNIFINWKTAGIIIQKKTWAGTRQDMPFMSELMMSWKGFTSQLKKNEEKKTHSCEDKEKET